VSHSLSGLDAAFLYLETQDTPLHVAQVCVFDPSTGSEPDRPPVEQLRALILRRLSRVPPLHQVPVAAPAGLGRPVWAEDPDFDVDYHLRPAALPAPAGLDELARFTAEFLSSPLDHHRPLWEMRIIEGLPDGMVAGVTKVHHSAIDGASGAELTSNLLDVEPRPPVELFTEGYDREPPPSSWQFLRQGVAGLARQPLTVAGALAQAGAAAGRVWRLNRSSPVPPPPAPFSAPATPFNAPVGPRRRVAFTQLDLGDVTLVREAFGATVNDVVLAICAGGLRAYLDGRDLRPAKDLVAAVPMSVRTEDTANTLGNRLTAMLVTLATTIEDPAERLRAIVVGTRRAKDQSRAIGADTLAALAELLPPIVGPGLGRLIAGLRLLERPRPLFNVMISNFRGPSFPLYCAGAKLVAPYPLGPLFAGAALNITLQSYLDTLFVGLVGDADAVADLDRMPGLLRESLAELVKQAGVSAEQPVRHLRALP
jgi:diacylglycerol O-acyltransferase / wax synthase